MDLFIFSQRLRRLLAGEEGTLSDGTKEKIQSLQLEIGTMITFLLEHKHSLRKHQMIIIISSLHGDREEESGNHHQQLWSIAKKMIHFAHESEAAIDTFIMNIMQQNSESNSELHDSIQRLQKDIIDIKAGMQQVQTNQTYKDDTKSIETQANNSSSSSVSVKRRDRSFMNKKHRMVGREDEMEKLLDLLIEGQPLLSAISVVGVSGLGKTTLAAEAYDSIYVKSYFDCCVWVVLSCHYNPNQILEDILRSVLPSSHLSETLEKDYERKKATLRDCLRDKKYLIVLDDVWHSHVWDDLRGALPDDQIGSRVLTTTCFEDLIRHWSHPIHLRPLNDEETWEMLVYRVLGKDSYQHELEPLKRSLEVMCQGWPFAILFFGGLLMEKDKQDVLSKLEHDTNYCLPFPARILPYSYYNLPFHLKPCFLYFAVFPEGFEISTRQLYQLWIAEGFIHGNSEATAEYYLEELVDRGFIQAMRRTSVCRIKTCCIHGISQQISICKGKTVEFISVDKYQEDPSFEKCRRLSVRSPHKLFSSRRSASHLSSFLCLTSNRGYLAPTEYDYICKNFKLLKVLNLGTLVLDRFPVGIEILCLLRYLKLNIPSLTSIPSSLCNLLNLFTLDMPSSYVDYVPCEFWKMHKLMHLNFGYITLPAYPGKYCSSLDDLTFISALHPKSCKADIFTRLPNLRSLQISGDLSSYQFGLSKSLGKLTCLQSLKLVNESKSSQLSSIVLGEYQLPASLTQLNLSNTELVDDPMPTFETLPHLEVLKLKLNSYFGRKLVCRSGGFPQLKILHMKSMLWLEEWTMETGSMPKLEQLVINPCAHLRKLPKVLWHIKSFRKLVLWWPRPELKPALQEFMDKEPYDIQLYPYGI